ncbi:hypothetical protein SAMN05216184_1067 [Georgenia satyanarayanai]|uniref:Uncharacterized protein n=1 Tax=Georgenia satyanarayanai TaxID=860221 RepID=A0A2Y9ADF6_9MICO|nr:hypothetical protein [Georgenia satyanarayanai]PYF99495.1 hypothetical protein A8987_1067 [Georgenia satyanarayanai]SSA42340.1 hypothetical protein SAMN05216184_1067 [Georgenia satyanarayanai]
MGSSTRGVATAALAAVLALSGMWHWPLLVVVGLTTLLVAAGWPRLAGLPVTTGPGIVIAATGVAALAVVAGTGSVDGVAVVLGLAVAGSFLQEMLRRDGRPRLVESVAATVTGCVVAGSAAMWPALGDARPAAAVVVTAAAALAAGAACTALPLGPRLVPGLATVVAGGAGLLAGALLPDVGPLVGGASGLVAGVLTSVVHLVLGRFPASTRPLPALAAAALPPMLAGAPTFMLGSLLLA